MKNRMGSRFGNPMQNDSNKIYWILAIILIFLFLGGCFCYSEPFKQLFSNTSKKLKDLDVVMFMSPECKYCKAMMEILKKEGVMNQLEIVNITKPEGVEYAKKFGADNQPIPSFISKKNRTGAVGQRNSVKEIIEVLSDTSSDSGSDDIKKLQILLFSRDGCPYCTKAKEVIEKEGMKDAIRIIDVTTEEGRELSEKLLPPGTSGVPAWFSLATKKSTVGFNPKMEEIIMKLK